MAGIYEEPIESRLYDDPARSSIYNSSSSQYRAVMAATNFRSIQVAAIASLPIEIRAADQISVSATESTGVAAAPNPISHEGSPTLPVPRWLDAMYLFIPKSIREPFRGDLLEDMARMAECGFSRLRIRWAAVSQIAMLVGRWLVENVFSRR